MNRKGRQTSLRSKVRGQEMGTQQRPGQCPTLTSEFPSPGAEGGRCFRLMLTPVGSWILKEDKGLQNAEKTFVRKKKSWM